jgi:hypothetical protein
MTVLKWIVAFVAVGYLGGVVVMFFAQRSFIYPVPQRFRTAPAAAGFEAAEEVLLTAADGGKVIVWHVLPRGDHAVVVYFNGNGD